MQGVVPKRIHALNEIFDKYIAFFFDMDGVLVENRILINFFSKNQTISLFYFYSGVETRLFLMLWNFSNS